MVAHARELDPFECCGLLAGKDGVVSHLYRIKNVVAIEGTVKLSSFDDAKVSTLERLSPEQRAEIAFVMDATDFARAKRDMRSNGIDLLVVYHSHPLDPARPSVTDTKIATEFELDGCWEKMNLSMPFYVIISLMDKSKPDIRAYRINARQVTPIEFRPI